MLLYQVGRRAMRSVFLTAVAAEHSGTQRVVNEFSGTLFTSGALQRHFENDLNSMQKKNKSENPWRNFLFKSMKKYVKIPFCCPFSVRFLLWVKQHCSTWTYGSIYRCTEPHARTFYLYFFALTFFWKVCLYECSKSKSTNSLVSIS